MSVVPDFSPAPSHVSIGREFCQNGFVILRQTFTENEIAELRGAAIAALPMSLPPYKEQFSNTALYREPFRSIVFRNSRLISGLRALLGDAFVFVNESSLHDSFFSGWHTDTTSPEAKAGLEFHWSPGFMMVNAGIYLQDNNGNGGGLDVVPGSYVHDDPGAIALRSHLGFPPAHRSPEHDGDQYRDAVTLRNRVGDAVIFHLRTSHRSSVPIRAATDDASRKLALFIVAGPNNEPTRRYRAWLDQYDTMNGTHRPIIPDGFRDMISVLGLSIIQPPAKLGLAALRATVEILLYPCRNSTQPSRQGRMLQILALGILEIAEHTLRSD